MSEGVAKSRDLVYGIKNYNVVLQFVALVSFFGRLSVVKEFYRGYAATLVVMTKHYVV